MDRAAWGDVVDYLVRVGHGDFAEAADRLDEALDRDGMGAIGDAFGDACRSLMDRVEFPEGTIDVHSVVDGIAMRVVEMSGDIRREALDRQRSLLVFLGSEGLPCAARDDVASWDATDRLHDLIACTIGLLGVVADAEHDTVASIVAALEPPRPLRTADGTFALAWRGPNGAEPFAGMVPRGYTAHITFLGEEPCTLRSIFGRVARLRDLQADAHDAELIATESTTPRAGRSWT
jgi:hypothetical protein